MILPCIGLYCKLVQVQYGFQGGVSKSQLFRGKNDTKLEFLEGGVGYKLKKVQREYGYVLEQLHILQVSKPAQAWQNPPLHTHSEGETRVVGCKCLVLSLRNINYVWTLCSPWFEHFWVNWSIKSNEYGWKLALIVHWVVQENIGNPPMEVTLVLSSSLWKSVQFLFTLNKSSFKTFSFWEFHMLLL